MPQIINYSCLMSSMFLGMGEGMDSEVTALKREEHVFNWLNLPAWVS